MKKIHIPYIVFCVILLTLFMINISNSERNNYKNINSAPINNYKETEKDRNIFEKTNDEEIYYIVKASNNDIFLYDKNYNVIEKLNINYNSLREYDKNLFLNGIKVDDMQDVYHLIEDFTN